MRTAIIIGAGPAGLTAAWELLTRTDIIPVIIEADGQVGGLSRTIDHHGNKIDIGGHRFFSKSGKVIDWWLNFLPLEPGHEEELKLQYQNKEMFHKPAKAGNQEARMLLRKRKSRIFYRRRLFDYPLSLSPKTLRDMGFVKTFRAGFSYLYAKLFPRTPEDTLEQFFINRFGRELYETFFRDYTEKVWGVPCNKLPASWGQQRIKNLDVGKLIGHAVRSVFGRNKRIDQKGTSTSLIEQFLYPKYGPGQMWETVAEAIIAKGGIIRLETIVESVNGSEGVAITNNDGSIDKQRGPAGVQSATVRDLSSNQTETLHADFFFSTMPVKQLLAGFSGITIPDHVSEAAASLEYRDFLIVGILADDLLLKETDGSPITDNWIYVQDKEVKAGRLQFFHNWSPYMIAQPGSNWIGVEYFTNESEDFWKMDDEAIARFAVNEMESIGILRPQAVTDTVVVRVRKAYPSYYGGYRNFPVVQQFLEGISNLFPIGRNGMHRYNNTDHSMLTAMAAVDNIVSGEMDKSNIWEVNTEEEYNEEK